MDRICTHITDAAILAHRTGDGTGDEFPLIDTAVIGSHRGVGLWDGAVQKTYFGMLHRQLHTGNDQLRRGCKDHIRALTNCLFHKCLSLFRRVGILVDLCGDCFSHSFFQISATCLMGPGPVACIPGILVYEGHVQMIHALQDLHDHIFLFRGLCFYHRFCGGGSPQVGPELHNRLFQF